MAAIFNAIKDFFSFIGELIQFVFKLIGDLIYTVQVLLHLSPKIPGYLSFLPATVSAIFVSCITLIIIYKITGRD